MTESSNIRKNDVSVYSLPNSSSKNEPNTQIRNIAGNETAKIIVIDFLIILCNINRWREPSTNIDAVIERGIIKTKLKIVQAKKNFPASLAEDILIAMIGNTNAGTDHNMPLI